MIGRSFIGYRLPDVQVDVGKGQLLSFARAVAENNAIYFDEAAARLAGHPSLPAPPTFMFSLDLLGRMPNVLLEVMRTEMGVNPASVLHGEQHFAYHRQIYAGDCITLNGLISDIYTKKGGSLEFVVYEASGRNQQGDAVGTMKSVLVVRNPPAVA